ncbi:MAG TPA: tripartite tricarboxylate transporter substrate binding protein [Xanthobacteraceae bacterium]|nr:tripartite tricarboxylate transporter substrate binding protein [Xanthobacteraceae bacterium]
MRFSRARRQGVGFASVFAVVVLAVIPAFAQPAAQWPDRPVRLLVPVGAGGAADTLSRNLSSAFQQFANGHPLIVENRVGAGGTVAAAAVAREKPDGYTLFLAEVGPNAVSHMLGKLPYDPHTAFTPIMHVASLPAVVLIRPTLPYKTLAEYVAAAKQQPGKFNYASAGVGNWTHLFMAYLNSQAGIDVVNVIYRSGAEMLTSLLRNDADTAIITVSTSLGQIKEGKIRALAGAATRPMRQLPEAPPVAQTIPGFDVTVWHGIVGPAGMDPALVARINGVFTQVLQVPSVRTAITEAQAADIVGGTPAEFDTFIKSELKRWPEVVRAAGIKPE